MAGDRRLTALTTSLLALAVFGLGSVMPIAKAGTIELNPNISRLAAAGGSLHVIVQARGDAAALAASVRASGGTVEREFPALPGFAASVSSAEAEALNHDPAVARIDENAPVKLLGAAVKSSNLANRYELMERTPDIWNKGYDGREVQVAFLDSGVYPHDDLVLPNPLFVPANTGNRLLALNVNPDATDIIDHVGHGTHVAGIIGGNGYDSNGKYIGVAPNSLLVSVKVSDDQGNLDEGDVITGLEWVYQANQHGMKIRVVNMSLASTAEQSYNTSALDAMVEKLWASGVTIVASQGGVNNAPGNDPFVITVGSVDDNFQNDPAKATMAAWSAYGTSSDGYAKPEVIADGSHVISLNAPGSANATAHPENVGGGGKYFLMGGTSMAAPQVAGMAALMLQARPNLTNNQVKGALMKYDRPFSSVVYTQRLGKNGGFVYRDAIERTDATSNAGIAYSQAYDNANQAILANGGWWTSASWNSASWNSASWNSTSWNSTSWNSASWNGTQLNSASWNSASWNSASWNSASWNSASWNSSSWNSSSWNSSSWNSSSWNSSAFD
ncbi:MAG: serine protease AprX [Chloroflexota bacterium]|nr:serine protease AprX [Chloroflexota bacterium]